MADIKVVKNVNPITIRIGQRTVKKGSCFSKGSDDYPKYIAGT